MKKKQSLETVLKAVNWFISVATELAVGFFKIIQNLSPLVCGLCAAEMGIIKSNNLISILVLVF